MFGLRLVRKAASDLAEHPPKPQPEHLPGHVGARLEAVEEGMDAMWEQVARMRTSVNTMKGQLGQSVRKSKTAEERLFAKLYPDQQVEDITELLEASGSPHLRRRSGVAGGRDRAAPASPDRREER